ncbi:MAG: hypothetical protein J6Z36_01640, partial [Clostridia bacterium]|nr:hypothetical protein [Clostridia bacterium]
ALLVAKTSAGIFYFITTSHYFFLIMTIFFLLALIGLVFLFSKTIYMVSVYYDRLEFKAIFHKKQILYLTEIKNVLKVYGMRESDHYLIDIGVDNAVFKLSYPFRFDCHKKTNILIKKIWKKRIQEYT